MKKGYLEAFDVVPPRERLTLILVLPGCHDTNTMSPFVDFFIAYLALQTKAFEIGACQCG